MTEAPIVSTAHTPIGKAHKGALNHTEGATMLGMRFLPHSHEQKSKEARQRMF
jgi:hypothetical protein